MSSAPPLRNEQIRQALDEAISGSEARLFSLLGRHGGLPGPRPNVELAVAVGEQLGALRHEARALVQRMISLDEREAPGQSAQAFLLQVGAQALASQILARHDAERAWQSLEALAGDNRRTARDGVVAALERLGAQLGGDALLARFTSWTDGFLQTAVALEALARRPVLDRTPPQASDELLARLDEAASLAEHARRSDERTQGRRRLLEALGEAIPPLAARFAALLGWLASRAATGQPELREAIERSLDGLRRQGVGDDALDPIRKALDASTAPLRDPTDYRGPTRGRGRKAQRREQRR